MIEIDDMVGDYHVFLLCEGDYNPCALMISIPKFDIVVLDDVFVNAKICSAFLEAKLGFGPATELLSKHNIPKTSNLWDLNHSRY